MVSYIHYIVAQNRSIEYIRERKLKEFKKLNRIKRQADHMICPIIHDLYDQRMEIALR